MSNNAEKAIRQDIRETSAKIKDLQRREQALRAALAVMTGKTPATRTDSGPRKSWKVTASLCTDVLRVNKPMKLQELSDRIGMAPSSIQNAARKSNVLQLTKIGNHQAVMRKQLKVTPGEEVNAD